MREAKSTSPMLVGTDVTSLSWEKSISTLSPKTKCADQPKIWKKKVLEASLRKLLWRQFLVAWERWHSPSSPIRITSYPFLKWISWELAYKWSLHGVSEGCQRKYPYVVGLRYELDERYSGIACEEIVIGVKDCRFYLEDKSININAWL